MEFFLSLSLWRDISIVWLSLFCFIGLVIPLVLVYFLVRGMDAALRKTSGAMQQAQHWSGKMRTETDKLSRKVAEPVVKANRTVARGQRIVDALWPKSKARKNLS